MQNMQAGPNLTTNADQTGDKSIHAVTMAVAAACAARTFFFAQRMARKWDLVYQCLDSGKGRFGN